MDSCTMMIIISLSTVRITQKNIGRYIGLSFSLMQTTFGHSVDNLIGREYVGKVDVARA